MLFDEHRLTQDLQRNPCFQQLHYFAETPSTNQFLLDQMHPNGTVCLADTQTQGRGQHGRAWVSPSTGNLYASMAWRFTTQTPLQTLPLWCAITLVEALGALGFVGLQLKWPNDVLFNGQKLAGILLESMTRGAQTYVVVGLGLNLRLPAYVASSIDQPYCDLTQVKPSAAGDFDVTRISAHVLSAMLSMLSQFPTPRDLAEAWAQYDRFKHQTVLFEWSPQQRLQGTGLGVDEAGAYRVSDGTQTYSLCLGQHRLRLAKNT